MAYRTSSNGLCAGEDRQHPTIFRDSLPVLRLTLRETLLLDSQGKQIVVTSGCAVFVTKFSNRLNLNYPPRQ